MKRVFLPVLCAFALVLSTEATAQKFSGLDKSPADIASFPASYKISNKAARVIYSRPQLKGRSISDLAPEGKVWRTGANEAAEITLFANATIGGENIQAGTYSLFTIPGDGEWTIILNGNLNQWGAYSYDSNADIARFKAKTSSASESLEAFSIAFKEANEAGETHLVLGWGTTRVALPMTFSLVN